MFGKIISLALYVTASGVLVSSCPIIAGVTFNKEAGVDVKLGLVELYTTKDIDLADYNFVLCPDGGENCKEAKIATETTPVTKGDRVIIADLSQDNSFVVNANDVTMLDFSQEYVDELSQTELALIQAMRGGGFFATQYDVLQIKERMSNTVVDSFTLNVEGLGIEIDGLSYYAWRYRNDNISPTGSDIGNAVTEEQTTSSFSLTSTATLASFQYPDQIILSDGTVSAESCGDPHFATWGEVHFDFHGACDLILVNAPFYDAGRGLSVYVRTQISSWYSYISNVIVKIGADIVEMTLTNGIFVNGIKVDTLPRLFSHEETREERGAADNIHHYHKYEFFLSRNQLLEVTSLTDHGGNGMFFVNIKNVQQDGDDFAHSVGLMGDFRTGDLISKDGTMSLSTDMMSLNDIVESWQVTDSKSYFHDKSYTPIYPEKCVYPKSDENSETYLMNDEELKKEAEKSCARWGEGASKCVYDVLRTKDMLYATYGTY